jgi:hypothetical protein
MKKLFLFLVMSCLALLLVSCGSKVTYVDPETNEEKTLEIKETENPEEVAASLEAIAYSTTKVASSNAYTLTVKGNLVNEQTKTDLTVKATVEFEIKKDATINTYLDLIKAMNAYVEVKVEGKTQDSADPEKQVKMQDSVVKAYLEDGIAYLTINVDKNIAGSSYSIMIQTVNEKTLKFDLTKLLSRYDETLDKDAQEAIQSYLQGKSDKTFKELLPDETLEGLKEDIKEFVEKNGVKISKVSGSKVTYSFVVATDNRRNDIVLDITFDVSNDKFAGIKLTYNQEKATEYFEATIKYSASVNTISSSEKEKAIDYTSLIEG